MSGENKRAFPRFRGGEGMSADYLGGKAAIRDLSLGGVCMWTAEPLEVGCAVRLHLHLDDTICFCDALVRRSGPSSSALEFIQNTRHDRRLLREYLTDVALAESREQLRMNLSGAARALLPRPFEPSSLTLLLAHRGIISESEMALAVDYQRANGGQSAAALVRSGVITEDALVAQLEEEYCLPVIDLATSDPTLDAVRLVPHVVARRHEVLPIGLFHTRLAVAIADPSNVLGLREIRERSGCDLTLTLAPALQLQKAIARSYYDLVRIAS